MRVRDLFFHVAVFVLIGAATWWWTHDRQMHEIRPPPEFVTIAPPDRDDLPAPRGPKPPLPERLAAAGFTPGDQAFIRIFTRESQLEVWLKRGDRFELFDTYPVCAWSGLLGPKQKEGDGQSPEGFYEVGSKQLNPASDYHLAFNLGYPNAYDRAYDRTGSALMVHGNCVSAGCYAMTDYFITEIYTLVAAALRKGQSSVSVHIFPFRMTPGAVIAHGADEWAQFWANLKQGYDAFEKALVPPAVFACGKRYAFGEAGRSTCTRVAAW